MKVAVDLLAASFSYSLSHSINHCKSNKLNHTPLANKIKNKLKNYDFNNTNIKNYNCRCDILIPQYSLSSIRHIIKLFVLSYIFIIPETLLFAKEPTHER